jgi:hypothetical protein
MQQRRSHVPSAQAEPVDLAQHQLLPLIHLTTILGLLHHLHQPAADGQPPPPTNLHFKNLNSTNHSSW